MDEHFGSRLEHAQCRQVDAALIDAYSSTIAERAVTVKRYFLAYGVDEMEAEDLTQDVTLAAYENLWRYDPRRPMMPWIIGIARNRLFMWYRGNRRDASTLELTSETDAIPDVHAENAYDEIDQRLMIQEILSRMSGSDAHLLVSNAMLGITAPEYASLLKVSTSGIAKRLSRAKNRFRSLISQEDSMQIVDNSA